MGLQRHAQHFGYHARCRPGAGKTRAQAARIAVAGFLARPGMSVDNDNFVAVVPKVISGGQSDHPRAQYKNLHAAYSTVMLALAMMAR